MSTLGTYKVGFHLALARELVYRFNFVFGRLRSLLVFVALIFLYQALPNGVQGYSQQELIGYLLLSTWVTSVLFSFVMDHVANEIVDGDLTNYLLKPLHFFGFWTARNLATRCLLAISGVAEILILLVLFPLTQFSPPASVVGIGSFLLLFFGAFCLFQLADFIAGILAFWTDRSFGPRWLVMIALQFCSGALIPIDIFPDWFQQIVRWTPFPYAMFYPLQAYLGNLEGSSFLSVLGIQWAWVVVLGLVLFWLWKKGVKKYEAYGR